MKILKTVLIVAALAAFAWSATVLAGLADPVKTPAMPVSQAIQVLGALRNLDGHQVIVKANGVETVVNQPWTFGSGTVRLAIATDIALFEAVFNAVEKTRLGIIAEITKGKEPGFQIQPNTPEMADFLKQYNEALGAPASGLERVVRIKTVDLRLDVNEIPVTTLSALLPILE